MYSYFAEMSQLITSTDECLSTPWGEGYAGYLAQTVSGLPCQRWSSKVPHVHGYDDIKYFVDYSLNPEAVIQDVNNYCRNPQSADAQPWCFTTHENVTREYCDIPRCKSKHVLCALISTIKT